MTGQEACKVRDFPMRLCVCINVVFRLWLCLFSVVPMLAASSAEADIYGQKLMSFVNRDKTFDGWTGDIRGDGLVSPELDLGGTDDVVLKLWGFVNSGIVNPGSDPLLLPSELWASSDGVTYQPVAIASKGETPLPSWTRYVKVKCGTVPCAITIGPSFRGSEERSVSGLSVEVITGTRTNRGVKAVGGSTQTVEVEMHHSDLPQLIDAVAELEYYAFQVYPWEEDREGNFCIAEWTVTALTPVGEVPLRLMSPSFSFGILNIRQMAFLPPSTTGLRMKWTFTGIEEYWDIDEETLEEFVRYPNVYVRKDWDVPDNSYIDFCPEIIQYSNRKPVVPENLYLGLNPELWYDVDNDGVMEWLGTGRGYTTVLNKFMADYRGQYALNETFAQINGWVYWGDNGQIGAYSSEKIYAFRQSDYSLQTKITVSDVLSLLDYNNDGRTDFWVKEAYNAGELSETVLILNGSGEYVEDRLKLYTPEEYYNYVKPSTGGGIPGMGDMFVGDPVVDPASLGSYTQFDINNDGYIDFLDAPTGYYLLNTGDGGFVQNEFGGAVMFRDFNGDGVSDYVYYNSAEKSISVCLQRRGDSSTVQKLFSGMNCSSTIWCRDFDNDGDVDILIPFDAQNNSGSAYLVVFENDGSGRFKKHEHYIGEGYNWKYCIDWNADGNYEVLAVNADANTVYSFEMEGINVKETADELYSSGVLRDGFFVADIDNSGTQRLIYKDGMQTLGVNTRPDRPAKPFVVYDSYTGEVAISWQRGSDKETAALDLTYELRIGTAPGKGDILWADAQADGRRRNLAQGNCGYELQRRLNTATWPAGKVYVSLQAIDVNGGASAFSDYAVFDKPQQPAGFNVTCPRVLTVGEECVITLQKCPDESATCAWDFDGATVLSENVDKTEWHIAFTEAGDKCISLQVMSATGEMSPRCVRDIYVHPAKIEKDEAWSGTNVMLALDMDLDGKSEVLTRSRFYEGDEQGQYTPVKRIFNSSLEERFSEVIVADVNRDGWPDVLTPKTYLRNEGDKSMEVIARPAVLPTVTLVDMNNDGLLDNYTYRTIEKNTGDYEVFETVEGIFPEPHKLADFNGDGLVDVLSDIGNGWYAVYTNGGYFNLTQTHAFECVHGIDEIADFDGDGKPDFAANGAGSGLGVSWYDENTYVQWSDGDVTVIPAPSGTLFYLIAKVFDFDNNGCQDLLIRCKNGDYVIVFFAPDRTWTMKTMADSLNDAVSEYRRTDGKIGLGGNMVWGAANTAPTVPTALRATQTGEYVQIEWNRSTDAETPSLALRYNISIKRKGAEGEGAYFISPLNGGENGVAVPSPVRLLTGNQYTIPVTTIPAGEYEVRVQAVDTQWQPSDFSEPLVLIVNEAVRVDMPTSTVVGASVEIDLLSNYDQMLIDGDEGFVRERVTGSKLRAHWTTPGLKIISDNGVEIGRIYIYPRPNSDFELPETVFVGASVRVACDNTHPDEWLISNATDGMISINESEDATMKLVDDRTVEICFLRKGEYRILHTINESYATSTSNRMVNVTDENAVPEILIVNRDAETGYHQVLWNTPEPLTAVATGVNIYKETARTDDYRLVATVPVTEQVYIDRESAPEVHASRYRMSYVLPYGESALSVPHQAIHVLITRGAGAAWNLMWSRYEGRDVLSYRILRGVTPETLSLIAEVSGNMTSYADYEAPASEGYYAVEVLYNSAPVVTNSISSSYEARQTIVSRSNVVSVTDAHTIMQASCVEIKSENGSFVIDGTDSSELKLAAYVYPVNATYTRVDWVVVEGELVAEIDQTGRVRAMGNGSAVIRAYATDGSGVYGEVQVTVQNATSIEEVTKHTGCSLKVSQPFPNGTIWIRGIGGTSGHATTLRIYDLKGMMYHYENVTTDELQLDGYAWPSGLYIIKADKEGRSDTVRFVKQ